MIGCDPISFHPTNYSLRVEDIELGSLLRAALLQPLSTTPYVSRKGKIDPQSYCCADLGDVDGMTDVGAVVPRRGGRDAVEAVEALVVLEAVLGEDGEAVAERGRVGQEGGGVPEGEGAPVVGVGEETWMRNEREGFRFIKQT